MKNYIKYFGILALGIVSCEPEFENPVDAEGAYSSGQADFSHYVALGNSLTAGYADNALYITGQEYSYPNILAQQFAKVGGGDFDQPLMADNAGGLLYNGEPYSGNRRVLAFNAQGEPAPGVYSGEATTEITETLTGPFNNLGAPGAKSYHLVAPGYGNVAGVPTGQANPYYARFATSADASILQDALAQEPTFFSLWIGNNDVLGYATAGGAGVDRTGDQNPANYGQNDITDPQLFEMFYSQIVSALVADGTEGVLLNIPDVTTTPFFNTVPYAPLNPAEPEFAEQISSLNEMYGQLNAAFAYLGVPERSIQFSGSAASAVVVRDESLPDISEQLTAVLEASPDVDDATAAIYGQQYGQARQANQNDLIPLTSSGAIGEVNSDRMAQLVGMGLPAQVAGQLSVNGITYPLEDQYVLIPSEQEDIATATAAYNESISSIAEEHGLALVDANGLMEQTATSGINFDAGTLTSAYIAGGAFSLDGIHLTPRGYALVANEIIEEINGTYNATVPEVNIGNFPTVTPSQDVN